MADKKNIFVIGLNDFNRQLLQTIHGAENYNFHTLIENKEIEEPKNHHDVKELLDKARSQLSAFPGRIDAIIGYIDMPVGFMTPILCREFGLHTASLESVLKCQHKFWSRLLQSQIIKEHVPLFNLVDPFRPDPYSQIGLKYPFWLKPVKSAGSYLAFLIHNRRELFHSLTSIRENIQRISKPFHYILECANLPPEISSIDFNHCLAEQVIGGRQCTLEGYISHGEFYVYGVVDSIRYPHLSTFSRYEYPSKLPKHVTNRMIEITRKYLQSINFDNSTFNVEFFWSESRDQIWVIEFNTRMSQSHSYLFAMVDGASNHEAMVDVGLGRIPNFPYRQGPYRYAAKFFYRKFENAIVTKVPSTERLLEIQQVVPNSLIKLNVKEGTQLSQLLEQDSYSYDIAWIFVAGNSRQQLQERYHKCYELLDFEFSPLKTSKISPQQNQRKHLVGRPNPPYHQ